MLRRLPFAVLLPLLLTGCLLSPGKFASELRLMRDGTFAYSYTGEIQMVALSKLAQMGSADDTFTASECYDDDMERRECSEAELAEQRAQWDAAADERRAKQQREAEQAKAFLGGIDPSDPDAAQELARRLERQRGWDKVTYRGDGLFDVEFAVSGVLGHDFAFPLIEQMPMGTMFVTAVLRDGGQVRIDAPGFAAKGAANPMQAMMAGVMGMAAADDKAAQGKAVTPPVLPEGRFTIVTDGRILANNTDEGPTPAGGAQALTWEITARTEAAPTALIDLAR